MTADDVIDSYVRDVAACLPRGMRNDVALELRSLLADELAGKAATEGRAPDKGMVMALLKGFGRPAEAARRYHERPAIIAPADTHHFLIWAIGGAVVLGVLSLIDREQSLDRSLFLQWLGVLVIFFGLSAWWRRRNPKALGWSPKGDPDAFTRPFALLALVATLVFPVFMYAAPETFVRVAFLGALPSHGVALTDAFRGSPERIATLALLVFSAVTYAVILVQGGYRFWTRWAGIPTNGGLAILFLMHAAPMTSAAGETFQVFVLPRANSVAAPFFGLVGAIEILGVLYELYRMWARIRPAPSLRDRAAA